VRGESVLKDDSGQFIILMGIIVAIGMVILLVFLNQSLMAGHSSSESIMSFPKNDIRELKSETFNEAHALATELNADDTLNNNTRKSKFNGSIDIYKSQIKDMYIQHGALIDIIVNNVTTNNSTISYYQLIDTMNISLYYTNGETTYNEITTIHI
jgi:hypothetical protein